MQKIFFGVLALFAVTVTAMSADAKFDASRYKYIGVFDNVKEKQAIASRMGLDDFRKLIRKEWQRGNDIEEMKYGNGRWIGVFGKSDPKNHQTYIVAPRWKAVDHALEAYWKQGYYITNIEHGLSEWVVVFEKNTGFENQAYERRANRDEFIEAVRKRWAKGYELIDIEYGEGHYIGIFAQHTPYTDQALAVRSLWYDMAEVIARNWKEGYSVTNIEYTLGRWMVLFSKMKNAPAQGFETAQNMEKFTEKFNARQQRGYRLVDLAEGW